MKRKPAEERTPREVLEYCRTYGHDVICGGQVLAIRLLLRLFDWNLMKLDAESGVSRQFLAEILTQKKLPTVDKMGRIARAFKMTMSDFDRLAEDLIVAGMLL